MSVTKREKQNISENSTAFQRAGKYLTFHLGAEEYGLEILKVREIIGLMGITKVPKTPEHIRGVINLRGKVIPVLELRTKFGMERIADNEETCIIVVDAMRQDELNIEANMLMGVLVDSVSEVLDIQEKEIQDAPSFGGDVDVNFILGIGKVKGGVKILLDIDRVINASEGIDMTGITAAQLSAESPELEEAAVASR
jgi:purine-binding chemotaxis protein CheW